MVSGRGRLSLLTVVPWDGSGGLTPALAVAPMTSFASGLPERLMRSSMRVRPSAGGRVDILAREPSATEGRKAVLIRAASDGTPQRAITVAPPKEGVTSWKVVDFWGDREGVYLLETFDGGGEIHTSIRKVRQDGKVLWTRGNRENEWPSNVTAVQRFLVDGADNVYVAYTSDRFNVAAVSGEGAIRPYAQWGDESGPVFMDPEGGLHTVRYLPETGGRAWVSYDPRDGMETATQVDDLAFAALDQPLGVGPRGEAYGVNGRCLTVLSGGEVAWTKQLDNLVVDLGEGAVYVSAQDEPWTVSVERWNAAGDLEDSIRFGIPADLRNRRSAWRLVSVEGDSYLVLGTRTRTEDEVLLVFSKEGMLIRRETPSSTFHEVEYRLQEPATWAVDQKGIVLLPVLGPAGLSVVTMR